METLTLDQQIQNLQIQLNELVAQKKNIKTSLKDLRVNGDRFILNRKDNEELFNTLFDCLGNTRFIECAQDLDTIIIWAKFKFGKGLVELQPCGTKKNQTGPFVSLENALSILTPLAQTHDTGRSIIKNLNTPKEIEQVQDLELGTNILDIA